MRILNGRLVAQRQHKEASLTEAAQLAQQGFSYAEIAKRFAVSKSTIANWLRELGRAHAAGNPESTVKWIAEITDRYEKIYREAIGAWHRSQAEKQVRMVEESGGGNGGTKKRKSIRSEGRTGDAAYLGKAMDALKAIREIKGLDAPRRTEIAGPCGGPVELMAFEDDDLRKMTNEQLKALRTQLRDRIREADSRDAAAIGVHDLHQARLPNELAPREAGGDARPGGDGTLPAADGLHAAPARQE